MQIDYAAKRSIKAGHAVDIVYTINVDLSQSDRQSITVGDQHKALSGSTVTTIHRADVMYSIATALVNDTSTPDIDDMREFLDSVKSGETFNMDVSGATQSFILDSISNPYQESREGVDYFRYSFKARQL